MNHFTGLDWLVLVGSFAETMPFRRDYAHAKVKEDRGNVALMRGPIIYCMEAVDNPNMHVLHMSLPRDATLRAEHYAGLLGGATVFQGMKLFSNSV